MFGFSPLDLLVIGLYFLALIGIGFWCRRGIRSQEDYFLGGRRFGKGVQTLAAFGMATSDATAITTATTTFSNGAAGIWGSLNFLFATPMFWMTSPWYRRLRVLTLGDYFEERFQSRSMGMTYAVVGAIGLMGSISLGLTAVTKTVQVLTPKPYAELSVPERHELESARLKDALEAQDYESLSIAQKEKLENLRLFQPRSIFSYVNQDQFILGICVLILAYAMVGGLHAAFLAEALQSVCMLTLSFLLLALIWGRVGHEQAGDGIFGAFARLHQMLPASTFALLGASDTPDFSWYFIVATCVLVTITISVQPTQMVANGSAKNEYTARFGFTVGIYIKRLMTVVWGIFALFALLLYRQKLQDPDLVWGFATLDLFKPLHAGLVGLMVACLAAATLASSDALMITASSLLTHNLFRHLFPGRSEKALLLVGRMSGAVVILGAGLIAIGFGSLFPLLKFLWGFYAIFAASFWMGILWRPATRAGAWASIITALAFFLLLPSILPGLIPEMRHDPALLKRSAHKLIVRTDRASAGDVFERKNEIAAWDAAHAGRPAAGRPSPLILGESYSMKNAMPTFSIFWTQGIKADERGALVGHGMFNCDLFLIDRFVCDLSNFSYAFTETLRILIRVILPFLVLIAVSLSTSHADPASVARFFAKMRTKIAPTREEDDREMALSVARPDRFDHLKLFPDSNWEIGRWSREDAVGFFCSSLVCAGIVGLLFLLLSVGR